MSIRILLVDESTAVRQGLTALLEREPDLEVAAAAGDVETAVRLARELAPQVIVMDAGLPAVNGYEPYRRLAAGAPGAKIIAMSLFTDRRVALNTLKAGASAYLLKDRISEDLAPAIHAVMAHKTYLSPGVSDMVIMDYIEALKESEGRFRTIFEYAPFGIALINPEGRLVETNPALQEMLGYSRGELDNKPFTMLAHPEEAAPAPDWFAQVVGGDRDAYQWEGRYQGKAGRAFWGRFTVSRVRAGLNRSPFAIIAILENIDDRRQAEEQIRAYQEQLRSLALEISLIEERERRTLATDLHDHIGQILALAQIKLGEYRKLISITHLAAPLDEIRQLVEQAIKSSRTLTFELSPPILYDLGFEPAVEWFGETLEDQYNLTVAVRRDDRPKPMPNEIRVLLFKAVRELMVNAAKHAQARKLMVDIAREGPLLKIEVTDDGIGFDPAQLEQPGGAARGFGLFSIRERLKHIGGRLEVDSALGRGTRITLWAPLWEEEESLGGR